MWLLIFDFEWRFPFSVACFFDILGQSPDFWYYSMAFRLLSNVMQNFTQIIPLLSQKINFFKRTKTWGHVY
jgi:hypothetical protein